MTRKSQEHAPWPTTDLWLCFAILYFTGPTWLTRTVGVALAIPLLVVLGWTLLWGQLKVVAAILATTFLLWIGRALIPKQDALLGKG